MARKIAIFFLLVSGFFLPFSFALASPVSSVYKYAWSNNVGYINFAEVDVSDSALTGYAWSENSGWINFSPLTAGVHNDGQGNLSGYAWGENLGWINFASVSINPGTGKFSGTASGDLIGTLTFDCPNYCDVRTDWRSACTSWTYSAWSSCTSGQQIRSIVSSAPAGCVGGSPVLSQSCVPEGGGVINTPPAVGGGSVSKAVGMNQISEVGTIDSAGINYLSYINSDVGFSVVGSKTQSLEKHRFFISNLDLSAKIVQFIIQSNSRKISLKLGESARIDLDNDKIDDLEITFANIWINRVELTMKSLFGVEQAKVEVRPIAPITAPPAVQAPTKKVSATKYFFKRNLATGTIGPDVKELQKFLNASGFILTASGPGSPGQETNKFGALTRQAVIKFQKANKISPAAGYFGLLSRKAANAK